MLVWALSISLATTLEITFVFFSSRYLDVSVHEVCSHCWVVRLQHTGLPHSDITGSIDICSSPVLFAACHVLHRLLEPRHPPYALIYFLQFSLFTFVSSCNFYPIMSKNLFPMCIYPNVHMCILSFVEIIRPNGLSTLVASGSFSLN